MLLAADNFFEVLSARVPEPDVRDQPPAHAKAVSYLGYLCEMILLKLLECASMRCSISVRSGDMQMEVVAPVRRSVSDLLNWS